ncbi:glycogen debranching protein GlgX [Niveibacterium umoris]|uniref:Glycogen operon protein n=1 Tax=Niveibacterium umoris TaxID=1193620 RepID=A0A840BLB6_9RHOO|nr:glycogen debranching protein GlgX [Niveibacterium umoris]MBB4013800.1 glycogen operon protein [Niveibacterium umoris]
MIKLRIPESRRTLEEGHWHPLGATLTPRGANFALYSHHSTEAYLLLFDTPDGEPTDVIPMKMRTRHTWHVFVEGITAGQLYGYRVAGPYDPAHGMRFNPNKLLIDPYARALSGKCRNTDNLLLGYDTRALERDMSFDRRDNARIVPKAVVVEDDFDWGDDAPPDVPFEQLIIYETHLKGFTAHPSSGVAEPGTYLGFIEKIPYLKSLGINAVEFLPIQEKYPEDFLVEKGLTNYWGYNTIGFFAAESSYSSGRTPGCPAREFRTLVRELHRAGIEVILDVVFNHTAEGNELGPTVSFRGIDNPTYYCLAGVGDMPARYYMNHSGTGNTVDFDKAPVIRFAMDCLRYWVEVMHVDGFRFDLAAALGREGGQFEKTASFFDAIAQDPVLTRVKLIAEPWDTGTYEVGNFPVEWLEWNGRFRDTVRRFVKGDAGQLRDIGWRVSGSADLYHDGRKAYNSVNFITCHDGFTLNDLVSYNEKHNEANLEGNRDGASDNHSWNCGVEGPTDDPTVLRLRRQMVKNHACMLLFSLGTPMLLAGDEFLNTQGGNNNAYCQDNEAVWIDWRDAERNADITEFFRKAIAFRRRHWVLQRRHFLVGRDHDGNGVKDVSWFGPDLNPPRWDDPEARTVCYQLDGREPRLGADDYCLFLIMNADPKPVRVKLPPPSTGKRWLRVVDTSLPAGEDFSEPGCEQALKSASVYPAAARSTVVLISRGKRA